MPQSDNQIRFPRILLLEPDSTLSSRMVEMLGWECQVSKQTEAINCQEESVYCQICHSCQVEGSCCFVLSSLRELHEFDLDLVDVVICSVNLQDGTGLDALAFVMGTRRMLPVVLTGDSSDAEMAVEAIRAGAADFLVISEWEIHALPMTVEKALVHQRIKLENERLQNDLSRSLSELGLKNQQLHAVITQLESMARTDDLTGMANRRWLNLMLEGCWADATRNDLPLACLMIDLDGFKPLNDQCGHQRGDELLRLAGRVIQTNCRSVDTTARYGGDEFCVLMPHTVAEEAQQVAQRILREFAVVTANMKEDEPKVTMSIGISHIDLSRPINASQLVTHADEALYAAKGAGKQCAMMHESEGVNVLLNAA